MRRDHLDAISAQFVVQRIAVVSAIANQVLWLGFDHVEVEAELHQADFVMVCRMRADRKRQSMAINNRHDFHAFSALRGSDLRAAALGHNEGRVNEAFLFVQYASVAKVVSNIRQYPAQKSRRDTKPESAGAQFCSSDSFAAAYATAHRC